MPSTTFSTSPAFTISPLPASLSKDSLVGAEVLLNANNETNTGALIDPDSLTPADIAVLRQALYENSVLVIRKQEGIAPSVLPRLAAIWDVYIKQEHSGSNKQQKDKNNVLSKNGGARVPGWEMVQVIGAGRIENYMEMEPMNLNHLTQADFHAEPLSQERVDEGETRFYRWHLDNPLYERMPGKVTALHSVITPDVPDQKIALSDGSFMDLQAGATAFISGARAFSLLTPEEQEFALNTDIQYAPRAYEWIRDCKATSDGLGIVDQGKERAFDDLTPWEWQKAHRHPMAWRNPGKPEQPHLQILGCCALSLHTTHPETGEVSIIDDLGEVRRILYQFQERAVRERYVYAHRWEKGDLVIFHNYGVWHSITGQLDGTKRLLWQCTMASGTGPEPARPYTIKSN